MPGKQSTQQWPFQMPHTMDHGDFTSMVITMWAIWHARRKLIHEEVYQSPLATYQFVQTYLSELKTSKAEKRAKPAGAGQPAVVAQWCPPTVIAR
jgi:hypothetical protein